MADESPPKPTNPLAPFRISEEDAKTFTPAEAAEVAKMEDAAAKLEREGDVHPIARFITVRLQNEDGGKWVDRMSEDVTKEIWAYLEVCRQTQTLPKAVYDMTKLAAMMDHKYKLGPLAYDLIHLCEQAVVRFDLLAALDIAGLEASKAGERQVTGGKSLAVPAAVGAKPPEGTVKFDKFAARRRM